MRVFANATGYGGVTVSSAYKPEYVATLEVTKLPVVIEEKGKITLRFVTPDRHNVDADHHFIGTFTLAAASGRKLRNPTKPRYIGPPPEILEFANNLPPGVNFDRQAFLKKWKGVGAFMALKGWEPTDTYAKATIETWSRTAYWEMTADEYEEKRQPAITTSAQTFDFNKSFVVTVPADAAGATLYVNIDGSTTLVEVGKNSADGMVICQNKVPNGLGGYSYQYVVKAQPVPTSMDEIALHAAKLIGQ